MKMERSGRKKELIEWWLRWRQREGDGGVKKHSAIKMDEGISEGWGDFCVIDNNESHYKDPAHRDRIEEIKKLVARVMKRWDVTDREE